METPDLTNTKEGKSLQVCKRNSEGMRLHHQVPEVKTVNAEYYQKVINDLFYPICIKQQVRELHARMFWKNATWRYMLAFFTSGVFVFFIECFIVVLVCFM